MVLKVIKAAIFEVNVVETNEAILELLTIWEFTTLVTTASYDGVQQEDRDT